MWQNDDSFPHFTDKQYSLNVTLDKETAKQKKRTEEVVEKVREGQARKDM